MKQKNENPKPVIHIKPHHFIDIITSFGASQTVFEPHPYGHAVHTVSALILDNPDVLMEMELGADDICKPCKHNKNGFCDDTIDTSFRPEAPPLKLKWNLLIDNRWCARLNLREGDRLTALEFVRCLEKSAGEIIDIYREIPRELTEKRAMNFNKGIEKFQKENKSSGS